MRRTPMSTALKKSNATKHGGNANHIMLYGGNYRDFELLRSALFEELRPEGITEQCAVERLAQLMWRRERLDRYHHHTMEKSVREVRAANERSRHLENLRNLAPRFQAAETPEKVEEILGCLSPLYRIRSWFPPDKDGDPNAWGSKIASGVSALKVPERHEGPDEFMKTFDVRTFAIALGRMECVERLIDRAVNHV